MKTFKAIVKNRFENNKIEIITVNANTKKEAMDDARRNGYMICNMKFKKAEIFDHIMNTTDCQKWDWKENN